MRIVAFLFLSLVSFLTAQPLMSSLGMLGSKPVATTTHCCRKMMKCPKKRHPAGNDRKCASDGCNPFMACAYGNFFEMTEGRLDLSQCIADKERKMSLNDNRLSAGHSESWHPPEMSPFHIC